MRRYSPRTPARIVPSDRKLTVAGREVPTRLAYLWWQDAGLSYTASGYGRRIPTCYQVHVNGRWRRVYCSIRSNIGTCYIGQSIGSGSVVSD